MGQKVGGYRRNEPYGKQTVRVNDQMSSARERSWIFEVNPKGRVGWDIGSAGRTEKAYGERVSNGRRRRKELEEVRKEFGCESNGLGRKGTKERGYKVYGEYTYGERVNTESDRMNRSRVLSEKDERPDLLKDETNKGLKKKRKGKKVYNEKELYVGLERARRKYEKERKVKIQRKRTNLKERRKEKGLEEEKKERSMVLGQTMKRVKGGERCEAVVLSGRLPTGKRRRKGIVGELENGLNHMEVIRNRENRRRHHAKSSKYGRKKSMRKKDENEKYGYYGYQIRVKGPLGGARRTITYEIKNGTIPRGTKKARRTSDFDHAKTKIGTIGVQVKYCYGRG